MKKNKRCKCGNLIWSCSEICSDCRIKKYSGKGHPSYIKGLPHCKRCGKKLSNYDGKFCQKCHLIFNNPMFKKSTIKKNTEARKNYKHSTSTKKQLSKIRRNYWKNITKKQYNNICKLRKIAARKVKINVHHIDLNKRNNRKDNLLKLKKKTHHRLHCNAYNYLVRTGQIQEYLKWFNRYIKKLEIK